MFVRRIIDEIEGDYPKLWWPKIVVVAAVALLAWQAWIVWLGN